MCKVVVPESQLSLAIGKEGQNVRLAARLTGWKIDLSSAPDEDGKTDDIMDENEMEQEVADILNDIE